MIPILDAGHGSVINNEYYCRAGGRKVITDKFAYYEGESNRAIVNRLSERLIMHKIPFYPLAYEYEDITLDTRVARANKIYAENKHTYLLSFHSNAGGGTGFEIWTSPGPTKSDKIATFFGEAIQRDSVLGEFRFRTDMTDGDLDKEDHLTILTRTNCPAVLFENLFFDNPMDLQFLMDLNFRDTLAEFYFKQIKELYLNGI